MRLLFLVLFLAALKDFAFVSAEILLTLGFIVEIFATCGRRLPLMMLSGLNKTFSCSDKLLIRTDSSMIATVLLLLLLLMLRNHNDLIELYLRCGRLLVKRRRYLKLSLVLAKCIW